MRSIAQLLAGVALVFVPLEAAGAFTVPPLDVGASLSLVAQGCGPGWYRGPGGACHRFGHGPYPGGYWGPYRGYPGNGCGPGWYRGPGGACHRYGHGPYPGGYWGPYY